jgi:tRNA(Arg) A34 adenosine deaminase TadA
VSTPTASDLAWLRRTFELARANVEAGDQAFAALLVDGGGRLLVEIANRRERTGDCTAHAETDIAREASLRWTREELATCTVFSSTEPCPMCSGAIGWSGIGQLVYGLSQAAMYQVYRGTTPRWAPPPSCRSILSSLVPPVEVLGPLLEDEAMEPHRYWLKVNG